MATVAPEVGGAGTTARRWVGVVRVARRSGVALLLTLWQVGLAVALAGRPTLQEGYRALARWDAGCYACVVRDGYVGPGGEANPDVGRAAWFPGLPLAARAVGRALGVDAVLAVLITSQLACWLFWTHLLLLFRRWRMDVGRQAAAVAFLLAQPGTFFLVVGYTESLFLTGLVGMIYWLDGERPARTWPAAVHGFVMAATRSVGGPLAVYPLLRWFCVGGAGSRMNGLRLLRLAFCSAVAASATIAYFAFCQARFGHWDQYFISERQFWGVQPDYLFLLNSRTYLPRPVIHLQLGPDWVSQCCVIALMVGFGRLAWREWLLYRGRWNAGWRERLSLGALAGGAFFLSVAAKVNLYMNGMLRFALPVLVLMLLVYILQGKAFRRAGAAARPDRRARAWVASLCLVGSFALQVYYVYRFTHEMWVA